MKKKRLGEIIRFFRTMYPERSLDEGVNRGMVLLSQPFQTCRQQGGILLRGDDVGPWGGGDTTEIAHCRGVPHGDTYLSGLVTK